MTGRFLEANGQRLALFGRAGMGQRFLFLHATGFHSRCWREVIRHLPEDFDCFALDMRGHGLSSKPAPPYRWDWFGQDVAAAVRELKFQDVIGAGHSMGGHALVHAAALVPGAFRHLVLLDPVIMPRSYYTGEVRGPHFARKRKNRWSSWEDMLERFADRSPFREWDPAVLRDYCRWALLPDGDEFVLACPPEIEGSIYEHSGGLEANLYGLLDRIEIPVTVVRSVQANMGHSGPVDMAASPTAPDLASRFKRGRDVPVKYSHFVPMEAPEFVAGQLRSVV